MERPTSYEDSGEITRTMTEAVDSDGKVIGAVIRERDWMTKQEKKPIRVTCIYDSKGRLVEQNTAPYDFENAGSEHELPPGKVVISYHDAKHTKKTTYSGQGWFGEFNVDLRCSRSSSRDRLPNGKRYHDKASM